MQNLIRLSKECVASFNEPSSVYFSELGIHAYKHIGDILILEQDGNLQSREKAYNPYDNNVLMKPTPEFIYDEEVWENSSILDNVNLNGIKAPIITASLNFVAGWFYNQDDAYIATRFYYVVDGKISVTVASFLDDKLRTNLKSNRKSIVLDRTIFNSCIELRFLDLPSIVSSNDPHLIGLSEYLFGSGSHSISELFIEYSIVKSSQVVTFLKNDLPFKRFYVTDLNKSYRTNIEEDRSLRLLAIDLSKDSSGLHGYELQLFHNSMTTEKYLNSFLKDLDSWRIDYEITTVAYNNSGEVLGSLSHSISNPNNTYEHVYFRPIIPYYWVNAEDPDQVMDHCEFAIRAVARTSVSGLEITRYATVIDNNPIRWLLGEIKTPENMLPSVTINRKQVVHKMEVKNDMPEVIKISKPVYVFAQPPTVIRLMHYSNTISIRLGDGIDSSIKLRLDNRDYEPKSIIGDSAVFTISSSEYFKDTKIWYVLDKDDNVIASGNIEKV